MLQARERFGNRSARLWNFKPLHANEAAGKREIRQSISEAVAVLDPLAASMRRCQATRAWHGGKTSTGHHDASGSDTTCNATTCGGNENVSSHTCVACPSGKTSTGSHDASGDDTTCDATTCDVNEEVSSHMCVACPSGKTSTESHDASGGDTT